MSPEKPQNNIIDVNSIPSGEATEVPVVHPDQQKLIEVPVEFRQSIADELGSEAAKRLVSEPSSNRNVEVPMPADPSRVIGWNGTTKG